jgi:glycine oxidase
MTDFIIVGRGLAANVLAHSLHERGLSFRMIGKESLSTSSRVAAGIWNPVVFKRLTKSWLADDLVPCLLDVYRRAGTRLGRSLITLRPIFKPFTEDQEKTLWLRRAGTLNFLDAGLKEDLPEEMAHLKISNGYGQILQSGNLGVADFLEASALYFKDHICDEVFDHAELRLLPGQVRYKSETAGNILFCEGYLLKENPLFNWIPLKPAKGEIMTLGLPDLRLRQAIFNRNGFLMDVSEGVYKLGATYAWDDLSQDPTPRGQEELLGKLRQMTGCAYRVIRHEAGIRPSSTDRRPVIGPHPRHGQVYVFNGLGTKGVMLAPFFAENFVNFYLQKEPLHPEVDVRRFYHRYDS